MVGIVEGAGLVIATVIVAAVVPVGGGEVVSVEPLVPVPEVEEVSVEPDDIFALLTVTLIGPESSALSEVPSL